jgi:ELMO/CED-12 family
MLVFFARTRDQWAFEEVYCQIFMLFDALWQHQAAGYMDFSTIIATIEREFDRLLARHPLSIDQFRVWVQQEVILSIVSGVMPLDRSQHHGYR